MMKLKNHNDDFGVEGLQPAVVVLNKAEKDV